MITPRLGYAWDRTLLYVKAGAAFVPVQASVVDLCVSIAAGCNNGVISTAGSHTFTTYTVGGGLEWAFADRWSVKGEYMFIGLGNNKTLTTCGLASTAAGTVPGGVLLWPRIPQHPNLQDRLELSLRLPVGGPSRRDAPLDLRRIFEATGVSAQDRAIRGARRIFGERMGHQNVQVRPPAEGMPHRSRRREGGRRFRRGRSRMPSAQALPAVAR